MVLEEIRKEILTIQAINLYNIIRRKDLIYKEIEKHINNNKYNIEEIYIKRFNQNSLEYLKLYDQNNNKLIYTIEYRELNNDIVISRIENFIWFSINIEYNNKIKIMTKYINKVIDNIDNNNKIKKIIEIICNDIFKE